jgi:hypothetical protein
VGLCGDSQLQIEDGEYQDETFLGLLDVAAQMHIVAHNLMRLRSCPRLETCHLIGLRTKLSLSSYE